MRFVVDKVALVKAFLRVIRYSSVSIFSPVLHFRLQLKTNLFTNTRVQRLRTFKQKYILSDIGKKKYAYILCFFLISQANSLLLYFLLISNVFGSK